MRKRLGFVHLEWECPRCARRNLGPQAFCNGCGAPQPEEVAFEQAAEERLIRDGPEIARAKAGPDVHCHYCNSRNPADASYCGACGAGLEGAQARERGWVLGPHERESAEPTACPSCGQSNPATAQVCAFCGARLSPAPEDPGEPDREAPGGRRPMAVGAVVMLALLCLGAIGLVFLLTRPSKDLVGRVQETTWTRTTLVEALVPVEREAWHDEVPAQAEIMSCRPEHRFTQDEPSAGAREVCGTPYTVDTGSGYGEVMQDCVYEVYEDLCTYTVQEWRAVDSTTWTGTGLEPEWPEAPVSQGQRPVQGEQRYEILFETEEGDHTYTTTDPAEYSRFEIGSRWLLALNALGGVLSAEPVGE